MDYPFKTQLEKELSICNFYILINSKKNFVTFCKSINGHC